MKQKKNKPKASHEARQSKEISPHKIATAGSPEVGYDTFQSLAEEERNLHERLEKGEILRGSPEERLLQTRPEDRWLRAYILFGGGGFLDTITEAIRRLQPKERPQAYAKVRRRLIKNGVVTANELPKQYPGDQWLEVNTLAAKPQGWRGDLSEGPSENLRARFVAVATREGAALGPPLGTAPLDNWLHRLFLYLRENKSRDLLGADNSGGIILHVCESSATFFAHLEPKVTERPQAGEEASAAQPVAKDRKKRRVTKPLDAESFHSYLRTMKDQHPEMTVREMCIEVDQLPANARTLPRKSWQAKSQSATWVGNYDHPNTKSSVKNFFSTVLRGNTPA